MKISLATICFAIIFIGLLFFITGIENSRELIPLHSKFGLLISFVLSMMCMFFSFVDDNEPWTW